MCAQELVCRSNAALIPDSLTLLAQLCRGCSRGSGRLVQAREHTSAPITVGLRNDQYSSAPLSLEQQDQFAALLEPDNNTRLIWRDRKDASQSFWAWRLSLLLELLDGPLRSASHVYASLRLKPSIGSLCANLPRLRLGHCHGTACSRMPTRCGGQTRQARSSRRTPRATRWSPRQDGCPPR